MNAPTPSLSDSFRPQVFSLRGIATAFVTAGMAVLPAACSKAPADAPAGGGMPPPEVTVEVVQPRTVPLAIELPATLAGSRDIEIRARVAGILERRNFEEGASVKKGQPLFTLDSAPFVVAAARIEADQAAAQARLDQAQRNVARLKPLREQMMAAQKDLDDALSAAAIAAADVKAAEARLRESRLNLGYTKVEAPIGGVAGRALVSEGTLVSGPEVLLTRVTQLDPIHVRFGLSAQEQSRLNAEAAAGAIVLPKGGHWKASVRLPDGHLHAQSGRVNFSDVRVSGETGTSEFQAIVPNPKGALRPGQFVRVLLEGATRKDALVVPQRAVLDGGDGKFVYLLGQGGGGKGGAPGGGKDGPKDAAEEGGKAAAGHGESSGQGGQGTGAGGMGGNLGMGVAQPAPVEVGDWVRLPNGENAWVIRKGLKAGDPVIVDGIARIFFPGMPVRLAGPGGAGQGGAPKQGAGAGEGSRAEPGGAGGADKAAKTDNAAPPAKGSAGYGAG